MPLTRDFRMMVKARVQSDPAFRRAMYREALEAMLAGDAATGKALLRDYVNATGGFEELGSLGKVRVAYPIIIGVFAGEEFSLSGEAHDTDSSLSVAAALLE